MANLAVANEIKRQLLEMDANLMMCMGASNFAGDENSLTFKVNGVKVKGYVNVSLDRARDLYNVKIYQTKRKINRKMSELLGERFYSQSLETVYEAEGVYFDQLPPILEREVEDRGYRG